MTDANGQFRTKTAGFTAIEALAVLGLATAMGLMALSFQKDIFDLAGSLSANLNSQSQVRRVLREMTTEIRMAATSNTGAYPIAEASGSSFSFHSDLDGDGISEKVRYFTDGNALRRGVISPSGDPLTYDPASETLTDIAGDIGNAASVFSYYDSAYDGLSPPLPQPTEITAVRLVRITLEIAPAGSRRLAPLTMTSAAMLRNLKGL